MRQHVMNKQRNIQSGQDQKNIEIRSLQQQAKEEEKRKDRWLMNKMKYADASVCEWKTEKSHAGQVLKWKGAQAFIFTV